jgi:hypothetical protein
LFASANKPLCEKVTNVARKIMDEITIREKNRFVLSAGSVGKGRNYFQYPLI